MTLASAAPPRRDATALPPVASAAGPPKSLGIAPAACGAPAARPQVTPGALGSAQAQPRPANATATRITNHLKTQFVRSAIRNAKHALGVFGITNKRALLSQYEPDQVAADDPLVNRNLSGRGR